MELIFKKDNQRYEIKKITISGDTAYFTIEINGEEYMWESTCFRSPTDYTKDLLTTLADTVELMTSNDHNDRLVAEYIQLCIRINKLESLIKGIKSGTAPFKANCPNELLEDQLHTMVEYRSELEQRFKYEGIDHIQGWYDCIDGKSLWGIPF